MFNLLRKENFLLFYLRFKKYGVWFFINFIIATIPFAIMFVRNYSTETLFSNFLSFNFGLIISSSYVLFILLDSGVETQEKPNFLLVFTFFWVLVIQATYVIYPDIPNKRVLDFLTNHLRIIVAIIGGVTVLISFLLNKPNIERSINEKRATQKMAESQEIKNDFKNFSRELKMDGTL